MCVVPYNNVTEITGFKLLYGHVQRLEHATVETLGYQIVEIDGTTKQLQEKAFERPALAYLSYGIQHLGTPKSHPLVHMEPHPPAHAAV